MRYTSPNLNDFVPNPDSPVAQSTSIVSDEVVTGFWNRLNNGTGVFTGLPQSREAGEEDEVA